VKNAPPTHRGEKKMSKTTINIGLLGFGNVGMGVLNILTHHADMLTKRTGKKFKVTKIVVRDLPKYKDVKLPGIKLTDDAQSILNDPDIQIIVEAMGGENPAYTYIKQALISGKFVVTANKEVISKHKKEFFELAKKHKTDLYFEAAVGGGIPLIRTIKVGFSANEVQSLYGILNGTTNYVLTQIETENKEFDVALKEAQKLGFAESDPHMDISGLDTAYKLSILAAVAFNSNIKVSDFYYEGIESITLKDIQLAKELGYAIKLLAIAYKMGEAGMVFKVHPTMIPFSHPLASVKNELNAVFLVGDQVGESMLSGKGAGASPTGSAIVSDIVDIAFDTKVSRNKDENGKDHIAITGTEDPLYINKRNLNDELHDSHLMNINDTYSQFYIRILVADTSGALAKLASVLGEQEVSIAKMIQKDTVKNCAEVVIITHKVKEEYMKTALKELQNLNCVEKIEAMIRVGLEEV